MKPFEIENGKVTVLETGSHEIYQKLILNFRDLKEDIHFSNNDFEIIDTDKSLLWVADPLVQIDLNKLFQHQLYKRIIALMTDQQLQQIFELTQELKTTILEASYLLDLPFEVEEQTDLNKVLKFSNLVFSKTLDNNPYGIIETVLKIAKELAIEKVIGFMNISDYLTAEEFLELVKLTKSLDLPVLLIKFSESRRTKPYENCRYYYIDQDYVDWR